MKVDYKAKIVPSLLRNLNVSRSTFLERSCLLSYLFIFLLRNNGFNYSRPSLRVDKATKGVMVDC